MILNLNNRKLAAALLCTLGIHSALANAQPENGKRHAGPPQEAITACAGSQEGDACSFSGRNSEQVQGSCFTPPQDSGELACKPQGGRHPKPEQNE